ncbi:MAG: ribosome small subunit-dependent GTPase A, partial [Clostridia bacterium]|nr:ribosome small subunit-dependent GTPase A [Clostridia bacterium]
DTPGFSLLDMSETEPEELAKFYPEMREAVDKCRFGQCLHISEPDCMVKELLENGKISVSRYERYKLLLAEIKENWRRKYD